MDTCITVWHWPTQERWFDEGIRTSLDLVRHAGFTHINWNPDAGSSYWMADAEIEFTRRIVAEAGLKVHSVHSTNGRNTVSELIGPVPFTFESRKDIRSPHEWQRLSGVELLKNRIDLAAASARLTSSCTSTSAMTSSAAPKARRNSSRRSTDPWMNCSPIVLSGRFRCGRDPARRQRGQLPEAL